MSARVAVSGLADASGIVYIFFTANEPELKMGMTHEYSSIIDF